MRENSRLARFLVLGISLILLIDIIRDDQLNDTDRYNKHSHLDYFTSHKFCVDPKFTAVNVHESNSVELTANHGRKLDESSTFFALENNRWSSIGPDFNFKKTVNKKLVYVNNFGVFAVQTHQLTDEQCNILNLFAINELEAEYKPRLKEILKQYELQNEWVLPNCPFQKIDCNFITFHNNHKIVSAFSPCANPLQSTLSSQAVFFYETSIYNKGFIHAFNLVSQVHTTIPIQSYNISKENRILSKENLRTSVLNTLNNVNRMMLNPITSSYLITQGKYLFSLKRVESVLTIKQFHYSKQKLRFKNAYIVDNVKDVIYFRSEDFNAKIYIVFMLHLIFAQSKLFIIDMVFQKSYLIKFTN